MNSKRRKAFKTGQVRLGRVRLGQDRFGWVGIGIGLDCLGLGQIRLYIGQRKERFANPRTNYLHLSAQSSSSFITNHEKKLHLFQTFLHSYFSLNFDPLSLLTPPSIPLVLVLLLLLLFVFFLLLPSLIPVPNVMSALSLSLSLSLYLSVVQCNVSKYCITGIICCNR